MLLAEVIQGIGSATWDKKANFNVSNSNRNTPMTFRKLHKLEWENIPSVIQILLMLYTSTKTRLIILQIEQRLYNIFEEVQNMYENPL
jgi:hypothetical protein